LDVRRYGAIELCDEFGDDFELIDAAREVHQTPWHSEQPFTYVVFQRKQSVSF
jgi:hypothetical protein